MRARVILPWRLLGWLVAFLVGASLAEAQDRPDADIAALGRTVQAGGGCACGAASPGSAWPGLGLVAGLSAIGARWCRRR